MRSLNSTAAALLGLLADGEMSGYDLHQTARERIGDFWHFTRSQVYRELDGLAAAGLVEAGSQGPRARRPFHLTADGRSAFAAWIATPPPTESIRFPLLLSLTFGSWVGSDRVIDFANAHREEHRSRLAAYQQMLGDLENAPGEEAAYGRASLAFGQHYERAVLAWMDDLPELLAGARHTPRRTLPDLP